MAAARGEAALRRHPLVAALAPDAQAALLRELRWLTVPGGTVLFDEGRPCEGFPLVVAGAVRVAKAAPSGREIRLYTVGEGDSCVMSTGCLLGRAPHAARATADGEVTLAMLPAEAFERLLGADPAFRRHVFALFSTRLAELMQLVEEVAFRRLDRRLAALLAARASPVRATHQALADELGSVREIVSRLLRGFEEQGLVRLGREQVEVLQRERLARMATAE